GITNRVAAAAVKRTCCILPDQPRDSRWILICQNGPAQLGERALCLSRQDVIDARFQVLFREVSLIGTMTDDDGSCCLPQACDLFGCLTHGEQAHLREEVEVILVNHYNLWFFLSKF